MKKNGYGKILKDGIITQNPVLVQVLGMCPTLAVSTALLNGLGIGAAVTMVLVFSNLFISLLRKVIDKRIRIASFIVIIAGFVTMVEMLMKAYLPSLSASLGVYIPLIVVNCIILARAEAFASRNKPLPSVVDGFACGVGFTAAICIVSAIREILGTGALLGYDFKLIPPIMIFTLAPGGLLVLGFVMAFCAWISGRRKAKATANAAPEAEEEPKPTGEGKVMEKAPLPPKKLVLADELPAKERDEAPAPAVIEAPAAAEPETPAPEPAAVETAEEIAPVVTEEPAEAPAEPETPAPEPEEAPAPEPEEAPAEPEKPAAAEQLVFAAVEEAPAAENLTESYSEELSAEERAARKRAYLSEKEAAREKRERKSFFSRKRKPEPQTEDVPQPEEDPIEPPSFMAEAIVDLDKRGDAEKEAGEND